MQKGMVKAFLIAVAGVMGGKFVYDRFVAGSDGWF